MIETFLIEKFTNNDDNKNYTTTIVVSLNFSSWYCLFSIYL